MCVYTCVWAYDRARVGLVVSLVFCDDDVFSVFHGMPRAALIVTESGPRATLIRMRAVALAFSVSPPPSPLPLAPPPVSVLLSVRAGSAATPCVESGLRGRARLSLGQVDGYPAAITPRLHARAHARTHARVECVTFARERRLPAASL